VSVASDNLEALAEDGVNQIRVEDLERGALAHDATVRERDDPRGEARCEVQIVENRAHGEVTTRGELAEEIERRELMPRI
jgi:hypothetical protein